MIEPYLREYAALSALMAGINSSVATALIITNTSVLFAAVQIGLAVSLGLWAILCAIRDMELKR